jgi:predicted HicB family RNase H-like nuclease
MSQTMQYKGYEGSVLYSAEDKILHGKLQGIRDFVIYDGEDVATLEKNFHGAVDEYLAFCEAEGKTPNVPFKGSVNVRLTRDLHRRAALFAEEKNRKLNAVINDALQQYLAHAE